MHRSSFILIGLLLIAVGGVGLYYTYPRPLLPRNRYFVVKEIPSNSERKDVKQYVINLPKRDWQDTGLWVTKQMVVKAVASNPNQPFDMRIGGNTITATYNGATLHDIEQNSTEQKFGFEIWTLTADQMKAGVNIASEVEPNPNNIWPVDQQQKIYVRVNRDAPVEWIEIILKTSEFDVIPESAITKDK